jgi:hypothetical protein
MALSRPPLTSTARDGSALASGVRVINIIVGELPLAAQPVPPYPRWRETGILLEKSHDAI